MTSLALHWVCVACAAAAPLYEGTCASLEGWDMLDMRGDGQAEVVQEPGCPPGYGPGVLHFSGDVVLALLKGAALEDGTIVALYRENDPRQKDADGVILFWADYGDNIELIHNTKEQRPHVWFEQDNDTGIQYRYVGGDGEERGLSERAGVGLVTDPWNKTNWIWQKVQLEGDIIRAKFWPAERPEPAGWGIEADYGEVSGGVKGKRLGIKINSGDMHLAYFAAAPQDIPIPGPTAYLFSPMPRIVNTRQIPLFLYLNVDEGGTCGFDVEVEAGGSRLAETRFEAAVEPGPNAIRLVLVEPGAAAGEAGEAIAMAAAPPPGMCQVTVRGAGFEARAQLAVLPTGAHGEQLAQLDAAIARLGEILSGAEGADSRTASLWVLHDAARTHVARARELFEAGDVDASKATLRFAIEAMAELEGYKGAWLADIEAEAQLPPWPVGYDKSAGVAESGDQRQVYAPGYRMSFEAPELEAQSFVAGHGYDVSIPWRVEGVSPDRDFRFAVRLVSPRGVRVPAQSDAAPAVSTSQWQAGEPYTQRVHLDLVAEMAERDQPVPAVVDEYHRLLVSVRDPATGAALILGNEPGDFQDRPGSSYGLGEVYVSIFPVEIRGFVPEASAAMAARTDRARFRNVGDKPLDIRVLFSATTETDRLIFQQIQPLSLDAGGEGSAAFEWTPGAVGDVTLRVQVWENGLTRTEAKASVLLAPPAGYALRVRRRHHVERQGECFVTPLSVDTGQPSPFSVMVYASGGERMGEQRVGEASGSGPHLEVAAEPWFGYYDVLVDCGAFTYDRRVVATVVETAGRDLLVNGEPFIVKGVNVHGMDASSPERTASMMRLMRELGFNAWRGDYPAPWQVDLAYRLNTVYTVLAPFSCTSTAKIFAAQDGPHLTTAREVSRCFVERYRDSAGVLLWNSCNEITGETGDFLESIYPVYKRFDPYGRPVHYANLFGQDFCQGQDVMAVNYYFGYKQTALDRQPMILRSAAAAHEAGLPVIYDEFNSWHGAVPSSGVDALHNMFDWGIDELGMCGGFYYMKNDSERHPGVFGAGYDTYKILDEALVAVFADARVEVAARGPESVTLRITNRRRCTLRQLHLTLLASGVRLAPPALGDLGPEATVHVDVPVSSAVPGPAWTLEGHLEFVTHFGFQCRVPIRLLG